MDTRSTIITTPTVHMMPLEEVVKLCECKRITIPKYQRKPTAWTEDNLNGFFTGVENNYFGMIVLTSTTDNTTFDDLIEGRTNANLTDGGHRLSNIKKFLNNEITFNGQYFSSMKSESKMKFRYTKVIISFYPCMKKEGNESLFNLLNSSKKLTTGETLNSQQGEWLSSLSSAFLEQIPMANDVFEKCGINSNRYKDLDYMGRIILFALTRDKNMEPTARIPKEFLKLNYKNSKKYNDYYRMYTNMGDSKVRILKTRVNEILDVFSILGDSHRKLTPWWLLTVATVLNRGKWEVDRPQLIEKLKRHIDLMTRINEDDVRFEHWKSRVPYGEKSSIGKRVINSFCVLSNISPPACYRLWTQHGRTSSGGSSEGTDDDEYSD